MLLTFGNAFLKKLYVAIKQRKVPSIEFVQTPHIIHIDLKHRTRSDISTMVA